MFYNLDVKMSFGWACLGSQIDFRNTAVWLTGAEIVER